MMLNCKFSGVANFASAVENHQQLVEEGALTPLVKLCGTDDPEAQLRLSQLFVVLQSMLRFDKVLQMQGPWLPC